MSLSLPIRAACLQLTLLILVSAAGADPAVIGGVAYDTVDSGEPFKEAPRPHSPGMRRSPPPQNAPPD